MLFHTVDPSTDEVVATYEPTPPPRVHELVEGCAQAQDDWRRRSLAARAAVVSQVAEALLAEREELADLMAREMGKVLPEGLAEVDKCAWVCRYYAENAERFLRPEPVDTGAHKSFVSFEPLGVVLAIMPWNFPLWQVFRFGAPALMAGNGVLLKHAPSVCGCSLAIEEALRRAGLPDGLFCSLIVDVPTTTALIAHPVIAAVTLTGSVRAGESVAAEAGKALKKCVLELGGSDAFVVLEDADVERAVEVAVPARFLNGGQSCIAAKRFVLVDAVREQFERAFVARVRELKVGPPREAGIDIGPLARVDLRDRLHEQVLRSVDAGARLVVGGQVPPGPGAYYPPTVLADVPEGAPARSEELFGPVAALIPVADEEEAVRVANATDFGLSGSIWTRDLERGERIARGEIRAGCCFVNEMSKSDPRMPFGGVGHSGYGRELSSFGIREFVNVHSVWVERG